MYRFGIKTISASESYEISGRRSVNKILDLSWTCARRQMEHQTEGQVKALSQRAFVLIHILLNGFVFLMSDILTLDEIDHVFGEIDGVFADAL